MRRQIDKGNLVVAGGTFRRLAHIVLIKGYTDDGGWVVNDPYGPRTSGSSWRWRPSLLRGHRHDDPQHGRQLSIGACAGQCFPVPKQSGMVADSGLDRTLTATDSNGGVPACR